MYLGHFGLREAPFALTPDIAFAYQGASFQDSLNTLLLALAGGEGFIKVTGEVGTGKTLLCRSLLDRLASPNETAYIPNPRLRPRQLLNQLALELGLSASSHRSEADLYRVVENKLLQLAADGRRVVLCIDEAQALPVDTLESLRLLSNLETGKHKLMQVVFFGQPEFDAVLRQPALRSLASRISFHAQLAPLPLNDFVAYLDHRAAVAGHAGTGLFTPWAARLMWHASGGVPRRANAMANKALLLAYGTGRHRVDTRLVWRAWRDDASRSDAWRLPLRWLAEALVGRAQLGTLS